jgi:PGF-pre-PGF domain-containing protein
MAVARAAAWPEPVVPDYIQIKSFTLPLSGFTVMRGQRGASNAAALLFAALMIVSVFSYVPVAGATDHVNPPPESDVFEVSDSVSAWERAVFPLRADTSDAAYKIRNAEWRVVDADGNEENLNKDPLAVYDPEEPITFTFNDSRADYAGLAGEDVEIVRARMEVASDAGVPASFSDALDQVTQANANENASFTHIEESASLDGEGELTFEDTPSRSGHYLYFVAVNETGEDGFTVTSGDIGVDGNVTIVGMDQVLVRKGSGSVDAPGNVTNGTDVEFDVDAGTDIQGTDIKQAVVLYDNDTFFSQSFVYNITADIDDEFDLAQDSTLESPIDDVNGVGRMEDPIRELGVDISDGTVSGPTGVGAIMDFIGEEASTDVPAVDTSDGDVVLDGSATGINSTARDTNITVETFGNWSTGDYRYVYVAVGKNSREMVTQTGVINITAKEETDGGSDGGGDDGGTQPPDDGDDTPPDDGGGTAPPGGGGGGGTAPPGDGGGGGGGDGGTDPPRQPAVIEPPLTRTGNTVIATVPSVAANQSVALDIALSVATDRGGITVERLEVSPPTAVTNLTARVTTGGEPPSDTPSLDRAAALGYVTVDLENVTDADSTPGTFEFTVSQALLDEEGVDPEDIVMYRFTDGGYVPVETTHQGGNRFQARTPGFSTFAVGAPEPAPQPELRLASSALARATVAAGETVDLSVTVENTGDAAGTAVLEVTANGEVVATQEVSVPAGGSETTTVSVSIDEPGEYEVGVSGTTVGSLTVEQEATGPGSPGTPGSVGTADPGQQPGTPAGGPGDGDDGDGGDAGDGDDGGGVGEFPALPALILVVVFIVAVSRLYLQRRE